MDIFEENIDFEILKLIQKDGRISFTDIAKELNVAVSTIRNRYVNLTEAKLINVYGRIEPSHIGLSVYATILVSIRPKNLIDGVINKLKNIPEVSFLASITGEFDIELNVMCIDQQHLSTFIHDSLLTIEGIYDTRTNMYLQTHKFAQPDLDYVKKLYLERKNKEK